MLLYFVTLYKVNNSNNNDNDNGNSNDNDNDNKNTVEPRLSGLVGTSVNSPDNRVSG